MLKSIKYLLLGMIKGYFSVFFYPIACMFKICLYLCTAFNEKCFIFFSENLRLQDVWDKKKSFLGEVAEWSIAAVLKTVEGNTSGGSNPSLSAGNVENQQITK